MLRSTKNNLANCTKKSESSSQSARFLLESSPKTSSNLLSGLYEEVSRVFFSGMFFQKRQSQASKIHQMRLVYEQFSNLSMHIKTLPVPWNQCCTRRNVQKWNTERTPKGKREKEDHLQEGGYLSKFQDHCPLSSRRQRHLILIINTWPPCLHSPVALQKLREDSQYLQSCHLVTFWTLLGFNDWIFRLLNPVQLLNWYNVKHLTFWSF